MANLIPSLFGSPGSLPTFPPSYRWGGKNGKNGNFPKSPETGKAGKTGKPVDIRLRR